MRKLVVDENYVKLNKETGELKPLMHMVKTGKEELEPFAILFNGIIKIINTMDGVHIKLFLTMCFYVGYTNSPEDLRCIMVDRKFVKYCNEHGLKGNLQYFQKRIRELEKTGLIVKYFPNVYFINPYYAFKGKLKTRKAIIHAIENSNAINNEEEHK